MRRTAPDQRNHAVSDRPLHLAVIIASTREGRLGGVIGQWFVGEAQTRADLEIEVIDLADVELPATHRRAPSKAVTAFAERIDRADAYVVVTPEYNHGYPAALKHAIDLVHREWRAKPVAFVSYGGVSGGVRAVEQLRQVFAELHATTVRDGVIFPMAWDRFDDEGQPREPEGCSAAAKTMLDQLAWWAVALRTARAEHPYAA